MLSLNCGSFFTVTQILLPFFRKYPIYGVKAITLQKLFKIVAVVLKNKNKKNSKWTPQLKEKVINIWNTKK